MIKKAIFGGTFDPIHNGHLHIAYEALYKLDLDKVIFVPSSNPPHKLDENITEVNLRYEMVKMAVSQEKSFCVSDYEIKNDNLSYTYKTLEYFNELEKDTKWYFITGVDCLMNIESWKNYKQIFKLCNFVTFNRPGYLIDDIKRKKYELEKKYDSNIIFLDIPLLDISSTNIRKLVQMDRNVSYLLPCNVYNMIKKLGLYKNK